MADDPPQFELRDEEAFQDVPERPIPQGGGVMRVMRGGIRRKHDPDSFWHRRRALHVYLLWGLVGWGIYEAVVWALSRA